VMRLAALDKLNALQQTDKELPKDGLPDICK